MPNLLPNLRGRSAPDRMLVGRVRWWKLTASPPAVFDQLILLKLYGHVRGAIDDRQPSPVVVE